LQLYAWKHRLCYHPDQDFAHYILQGIQCGFYIGTDPPVSLESATKNMSSAMKHPTIVDDYLKKESNILSPFPLSSAQQSTLITLGLSPTSTTQINGDL